MTALKELVSIIRTFRKRVRESNLVGERWGAFAYDDWG